MQDFDRIPLSIVAPYFTNWAQAFIHHEVHTVFFLPHADLLFRVKQFTDWLHKTHQMTPYILDLEVELISDPKQLAELLEQHQQSPIILIAKREFVNPNCHQWQAVIEHFRFTHHHGITIFHEAGPSELQTLNRYASFSINQTLFPLYLPEQAVSFCAALTRDWQLKLNPQDFVIVTEYCGGVSWLVKEIFRQIRDGKISTVEAGFQTEAFIWKVDQFWNDLPLSYRTALLNPLTAQENIIKELRAFRVLLPGTDVPDRTWPFLLSKITVSHHQAITCTAQLIRYFEQDFTHSFSPAERRILATLWSTKNQVVSREKLGESFWQSDIDEKYSDWALDQVMRRIKLKIKQGQLPIIISTKRGQGYVAST